jgi:hypothetical protein
MVVVSLNLEVVGYYITSLSTLLFREVIDQLICLDRYFGRSHYSPVNKEIAEVLLRLANE